MQFCANAINRNHRKNDFEADACLEPSDVVDNSFNDSNKIKFEELSKKAKISSLYSLNASSAYLTEIQRVTKHIISVPTLMLPRNRTPCTKPYEHYSSQDFIHPLSIFDSLEQFKSYMSPAKKFSKSISSPRSPGSNSLSSINSLLEEHNTAIFAWKYDETYIGLWMLLAELLLFCNFNLHCIQIYERISTLFMASILSYSPIEGSLDLSLLVNRWSSLLFSLEELKKSVLIIYIMILYYARAVMTSFRLKLPIMELRVL